MITDRLREFKELISSLYKGEHRVGSDVWKRYVEQRSMYLPEYGGSVEPTWIDRDYNIVQILLGLFDVGILAITECALRYMLVSDRQEQLWTVGETHILRCPTIDLLSLYIMHNNMSYEDISFLFSDEDKSSIFLGNKISRRGIAYTPNGIIEIPDDPDLQLYAYLLQLSQGDISYKFENNMYVSNDQFCRQAIDDIN